MATTSRGMRGSESLSLTYNVMRTPVLYCLNGDNQNRHRMSFESVSRSKRSTTMRTAMRLALLVGSQRFDH